MDTVERGTSFSMPSASPTISFVSGAGHLGHHHVPGIINRDFADVKAIMHGQGYAVMGTAVATGTTAPWMREPRHRRPLLEDNSIQGAQASSSTFWQLKPHSA